MSRAVVGATGAESPAGPEASGAGSSLWKPEFDRFRTTEYIGTGAMLGAVLTLELTLPSTSEPRWQEKLSLDENMREFVRAGSRRSRSIAGGLSDVLMIGLTTYPVLVDSLFAAGGRHGEWDVAGQMLAINAQAFALTTLITTITKNAVRRARPYARKCDSTRECGDGANRSFISGHTSLAFTGAGLICAHNTNMNLYGDEATGRAACFTAMGAATTVGAMRMVADKHYLTDVVLGAAVGLFSGYFLPQVLHYGGFELFDDEGDTDRRPEASEPPDGHVLRGNIAPLVGPDTAGLSISGTF